MKILICSKLFFPDNEIGAVRPTNFAKYLHEMGHEVTVIAGLPKSKFEQPRPDLPFKIKRVNYSKTALKLIERVEHAVKERTPQRIHIEPGDQKNKNITNQLNQKFKAFRLQVFSIFLEIDWYLKAKKTINKKQENFKYDIVLSSFGPFGSHLIGRNIKKKKIACYWISDLRDNMQTEDYSKTINCIYSYFEKNMMRKADVITVVSKGQYNMLQRSVGRKIFRDKNVQVIYNGYENKIEPVTSTNNSEVLKITYTGSLYAGKRDMSLLFRAISDLIGENKINPVKIEINYAGTSSPDLFKQAHLFDISEIIHDHGYLSRSQSMELQKSSDILVVLSWNTTREQGILSGKFFEYLQAFKPIITITCGYLENAELTKMVENLNVGIGCEYIKYQTDLIRLKDFILSQYDNITNKKPLNFSPNLEKLESFRYEEIAKQVEEICVNLMNSKNKRIRRDNYH